MTREFYIRGPGTRNRSCVIILTVCLMSSNFVRDAFPRVTADGVTGSRVLSRLTSHLLLLNPVVRAWTSPASFNRNRLFVKATSQSRNHSTLLRPRSRRLAYAWTGRLPQARFDMSTLLKPPPDDPALSVMENALELRRLSDIDPV